MVNHFRSVHFLAAALGSMLLFSSCSVNKQLSRQAEKIVLADSAIRQGHIGISIYEPATGKYWYEYNAAKYFIPASNTKLFSLYAGLKYLGDSLVGIRYTETADTLFFEGTGDPTLLHPEYPHQPVMSFLQRNTQPKSLITNSGDRLSAWGSGWAWNDYEASYMAERNVLPIFGNVASFRFKNGTLQSTPALFANGLTGKIPADGKFNLNRPPHSNEFYIEPSQRIFSPQEIPFKTNNAATSIALLAGNIGHITTRAGSALLNGKEIYTQPTDSLLKPMMHRSDNFFAEQVLIMASKAVLGYMSDRAMIDTLLNSDFINMPQRPRWVDGSGLSRYNLFTPQSLVWLLGKMKNDFGWERMQNILPTGGEGTLSSYYKTEQGFIFAKTGTLSNNCALSGYLITKKNKLLIFSVLANNYPTSATPVRRAVEQFLKGIREKY